MGKVKVTVEEAPKRKTSLVVGLVVLAAVAAAALVVNKQGGVKIVPTVSESGADQSVGAPPATSALTADHAAMHNETAAAENKVVFGLTVANTGEPAMKAPSKMTWIPGGEFSMGAKDPPGMDDVGMKATLDSRPVHRVYVDGFFMDKTDVTNTEFERFVKATGSNDFYKGEMT